MRATKVAPPKIPIIMLSEAKHLLSSLRTCKADAAINDLKYPTKSQQPHADSNAAISESPKSFDNILRAVQKLLATL